MSDEPTQTMEQPATAKLQPIKDIRDSSAKVPATSTRGPSVRSNRRTIAIGALLAFGLNLYLARDVISSAQAGDASAVQVIQVWVPHIYYAILITGVTVALYVWTRGGDAA